MDRTTVCNLAVGYFNEAPREEWDNVDKLARLCDLYLPRAEEAVRSEHKWSFLTEEMPIITDAGMTDSELTQYSHNYAVPTWVASVESVSPSTSFSLQSDGYLATEAQIDSFRCTTNDGDERELYTFKPLGRHAGMDYCYRLPKIVGRIVKINNNDGKYRLVSSSILSSEPVTSFLYIDKNATSDNITYESMVANKLAQLLLPSQGADRNIAQLLFADYARMKEELLRGEVTAVRERNSNA